MTEDNNQLKQEEKPILDSVQQEIYRLGYVPRHLKSDSLLALETDIASDEASFGGTYLGRLHIKD